MAANFALAPGLATADIINYNSIAGKALYAEATRSVYDEKEEKYDGTAAKLQGFLYRIRVRADQYGWNENGIPTKESLINAVLAELVAEFENRGLLRADG